MANEPKSPITILAESLAQQPSLKVPGVPVFPWRQAQAKNTAARRIVLYPLKSGLPAGASVSEALCDVDQHLVAECWGNDGEVTWAMMTWLIQALESQGIGTEGAPGFYWELLGADWETAADTTARGQVVSVIFSCKFTVYAVPFDLAHMGVWPTGRIDKVSQDMPANRTEP